MDYHICLDFLEELEVLVETKFLLVLSLDL